MPNVVSLYEKYHKKGLEIVGISFDEDETTWKNAVKTMNMTWPQASELRSWDNIMTQKYGVTSIPYTILIDSNGTIIGQQLRGEELENTVKQYLEWFHRMSKRPSPKSKEAAFFCVSCEKTEQN